MAMPLKLIFNVKKISPKQKAGLACVFSLCFVMIAFSIIRAKQVLVPQYFVNLTLLMIWSTLAASICELIYAEHGKKAYIKMFISLTCLLLAVIVGSLPPLKILITNRASAKRSRNDSRNHQFSNNDPRKNSVVLSSLSSERKHAGVRCPTTSESQEEMLRSGGAQFVMVKHDV